MKMRYRVAVVSAAAVFLTMSAAMAGPRGVPANSKQQSSWDLWDILSYGIGYVPTPGGAGLGYGYGAGAFSAGYCIIFESVRTNLKYNEELYPWEALSCFNYVVPYLGTVLGKVYQRNLPKICREGPGAFQYNFPQTSFYTIDRPAEAYAWNAYWSICKGRPVSHSNLPPRGYKYPPYQFQYISPY